MESMPKNNKSDVYHGECKWYRCCPMKYFYEEGKLGGKWINMYCKSDWKKCVRYWKEENGEYHSDKMLPDGTIDEAL